MLYEHRWHQWACLPDQGGQGPLQGHQDCPPPPHVCHQGPGGGYEQLLCSVQVHQALLAEEGGEQVSDQPSLQLFSTEYTAALTGNLHSQLRLCQHGTHSHPQIQVCILSCPLQVMRTCPF